MAAVTFVAGAQSFSLAAEDLQRYPDSLLASLAASVAADKGSPVSLKEQDLPDSLFSWPGAGEATVALYKNECLPLATLSGLLKTHTAADLYSKLAALIDFLGVPGPVSRLLPPMTAVPLYHVGVLDLHYHSLGHKTAVVMLDSVACHTCSAAKHRAAAFCIAAVEDSAKSIVDVAVYALDASVAAAMVGKQAGGIGYLHNLTAEWLGAGKPEGTCSLDDLVIGAYPTKWGTALGSKHASLGAPLAAALQAAVAEIAVNGCTGCVKVTCVEAAGSDRSYHTAVPVWLVSW